MLVQRLGFALLWCAWCSCAPARTAEALSGELVVYSPHGTELEDAVKKRFVAQHPGVTLTILDIPASQIANRLQAERTQPACDVWWGGTTADFQLAEADGLLTPCEPSWRDALPRGGRGQTGRWYALYQTPTVIMYNAKKLKREDVPTTWEGLLDLKWKGRIVVRDVRPSGTMKTIFCGLIWREWKRTGQIDDGFHFLGRLHWNTGAYAADPQAMYEMLQGPNDFALAPWNMPDVFLQRDTNGLPFEFVIPEDAPAPFDPVALVAGAPHPELGRAFIEFVGSTDELLLQAAEFNRLPARTDLPPDRLPAWMKDLNLKPLQVDWSALREYQAEWIDRWYREIKSNDLPPGEEGRPRWALWLSALAVSIGLAIYLRKKKQELQS